MALTISKGTLEWLRLSEEERKKTEKIPIAFIQLQNHVLVTDDEVVMFEPTGVALEKVYLEWHTLEQKINVDTDGDCPKFNVPYVSMQATPFGFSHTDIVVCWDHKLRPHWLILSRPGYQYYWQLDTRFDEVISYVRQRVDVDLQQPVFVKDKNQLPIEAHCTKSFIELSSSIMYQNPKFIYKELDEHEIKIYEQLIEDFQNYADSANK